MAEKLKIISLGGLNEIGKNITVLEPHISVRSTLRDEQAAELISTGNGSPPRGRGGLEPWSLPHSSGRLTPARAGRTASGELVIGA